MKFLLDENLSTRHGERLRRLEQDAIAVLDAGLAGADDSTIRSAAIRAGRVLVTLDADFGNIVRYPVQNTPRVIWLRLHPPTETSIAEALDRCLERLGGTDLAGKLVVVDEDKIRVRG